MRHFRGLVFQADPDGGGTPAGADPPAAPPALEPVPAPAAAAPAPASWAPSREEWDQTQEFQRLIIEALQEPEPDPTAGVPPQIDFSNPQAVIDLIEQKSNERAEALIGERFGPYQPVMDQMVAEQGKALVMAELDKLSAGDAAAGVAAVGPFDKEMAAQLAQAYFHPSADPREVLLAAARATQAWEMRVKSGALDAERTQMQNRLDAGATPSGPAADLAPGYPPGAPEGLDKYQLTAWRWEQTRKAQGSPVG